MSEVSEFTHADKADVWDVIAAKNDEISRLRKEAAIMEISVEAMAEMKAIVDAGGHSLIPVKDVVYGALEEIKALSSKEKKMDLKALPDSVDVEYHFKNSVHVFTSLSSAGLVHIDNKDREEAFNRIGPVLSDHFSAFGGNPVHYSPSLTYTDFCALLDGDGCVPLKPLAFTLEEAMAA